MWQFSRVNGVFDIAGVIGYDIIKYAKIRLITEDYSVIKSQYSMIKGPSARRFAATADDGYNPPFLRGSISFLICAA